MTSINSNDDHYQLNLTSQRIMIKVNSHFDQDQ